MTPETPILLEGIVTTRDAAGGVHISPMGPIVEAFGESEGGCDPVQLVLRPYPTSTTYGNLRREGQGVFHVTDDVELLARAAVGRLEETPPLLTVEGLATPVLAGACRWYAFEVREIEECGPPHRLTCEVVKHGRLRDFLGFNRARHAVLEAAILATRIEYLPAAEITRDIERLRSPVEKTGGPAELRAFAFLTEYIEAALATHTGQAS